MHSPEEVYPLGLHSHDLYSINSIHHPPMEVLPISWQGGSSQIGHLRYTVWSYAITSECKVAKPKLTPAIWGPPNFPDPEAPPITLLPPKGTAEECLPDDMHVFYPSVVSALDRRGLTIPQCTISHAGDGALSVEIEENKVPLIFVAHEESPIKLIRLAPSTVKVFPNKLTTIGTIHKGSLMPIFSLYSADRPLGERLSEARLPFRVFAMRIEAPLLNLLAQPIGKNSV